MIKRVGIVIATLVLSACATGGDGVNKTQVCAPIDEHQVAALFERWNQALQTGNPQTVADNYAEHSILLRTLSDVNRVSKADKEDYFVHYLASQPAGRVTSRLIDIGCNTATDSGMYVFTMGATGQEVQARYTFAYKWIDGQWLITNHHSSLLPVVQ